MGLIYGPFNGQNGLKPQPGHRRSLCVARNSNRIQVLSCHHVDVPCQLQSVNRQGPQTPAQHLSGFMHYLKAECGLSDNTLMAYQRDLIRFKAWYRDHGPAKIQLVDLGLLSRYLQDLHEHQYAATSMARHLVALKMFFRYLVLEAIIPESVVELVNSPKLWQHLPKVLSPEKVDELIAAPLAWTVCRCGIVRYWH